MAGSQAIGTTARAIHRRCSTRELQSGHHRPPRRVVMLNDHPKSKAALRAMDLRMFGEMCVRPGAMVVGIMSGTAEGGDARVTASRLRLVWGSNL